jgi:drug/metabolite transporter (DMT)-like permease
VDPARVGILARLPEPLGQSIGQIVLVVELLDLDPGVGEPAGIVRSDDRRDCAMVTGGGDACRLPVMPASALLLALAAAVVHAVWNLVLSGSDDVRSSTAIAVAFGVIVFAPVAALTWRLHASAIPFIAGSSAFEVLYLVLLATGYSVAAMSFVYPVARGSAPVVVLLVGAIALGAGVSLLAALGVVAVGAGILLVRESRMAVSPRNVALALAVGASIAGYTLIDKHGIAHGNPIAYFEVVLAVTAVAYVALAWRLGGGTALRAAIRPSSLLAGVGVFGSYALVLAALRLAPAASVAAVRESSVVIATAVLAIGGREQVGIKRLIGAVAVVGGIAMISLG